jgi:hypothetical protein
MGAGESRLDDEGEFPYFQMLQWAATDLPENNVMKYNLDAAKTTILEIPKDEAALIDTQPDGDIRLRCFEGTEREVWEDWAEALLERDAELSELRYKLVPRKLTEHVFWQKYFSRAKFLLLETVIST